MSGTRGLGGRPVEDLGIEALARGELGPDDARIAPDTLRHQADVAELHGYRPLAANLRRAAELALLADDEVLALYEALRPGRATGPELAALAERIAPAAPLTAALVRSARDAYGAAGILARD